MAQSAMFSPSPSIRRVSNSAFRSMTPGKTVFVRPPRHRTKPRPANMIELGGVELSISAKETGFRIAHHYFELEQL
ncbi:MAG: hypothetical protein VCD31_13855 [Alphaproteobacteria bacterium]